MKKTILGILRIYKKYLSWGYNCRFVPSCSEYMYLAIAKYGLIGGGLMGVKRIIRCNPWSKGGIDLVQ